MRSEIARKTEADSSVHVLPAVEADQGHGPLALLALFSAGLLCYLLF